MNTKVKVHQVQSVKILHDMTYELLFCFISQYYWTYLQAKQIYNLVIKVIGLRVEGCLQSAYMDIYNGIFRLQKALEDLLRVYNSVTHTLVMVGWYALVLCNEY
jgi:hypothetical protein